ncbi:MAG TPA: hypothetical protein VL053_07925 [Arachidicoccus sp.]|nr:hypothetical protein [Arachidicoccus sp.]
MGNKNQGRVLISSNWLRDVLSRPLSASISLTLYLSLTAFFLLTASCNKTEMENYGATIQPYQNYLSLQPGELSYYRLDSTVVAPFGASLLLHRYLVKDSVGKMTITDTDTSFSVYRFMTDTLLQQPWVYSSTYRMILRKNTAERIDEQNRRFIILASPVKEDYNWEGNRYFSSDINPGDFYYGWVYTYHMDSDLSAVKSTIGATDLLSVDQVDITNGNPGDFDPSLFQEIIYAREVYGRAVGLVQKTVTHITYQANQSNPNAFGYYQQESFRFQLTRIKSPTEY